MTPVLKSQRWSDGYGSDGERTMPKKEIRKNSKDTLKRNTACIKNQ